MSDPSDLTLQVSTPCGALPRTVSGFPIGIAIADQNRYLIHANQAFCEYLGYLPEELRGLSVDAITHPEDLVRTAQVFTSLQSSAPPAHTYEKRFVRKDGSIAWALTTVNRLSANGSAPWFLGFIHDITHQKCTEKNLRDTRELYQVLVENLGVGLVLIDRDHRVQMVNAKVAGQFAKHPDQFVGKSCFREFEQRSSVCPHCPGVQAMATGQPHSVVTRGIRKDGTRFKVRIKACPILDRDGACSGFVELVEDLTPQLKIELALEQSEERFKSLAETAPLGIFEISPEGLNTYSNPAWSRITGLSFEESQGLGWTAAIPPGDRQRVLIHWQEGKRPRGPWQKERRLLHRDGQLRWVRASAVPVCDSDGAPIRYVGTIVDVTEQKQAMEKLSESEERFRRIFEKAGVGMNVIGPDGRILDANPAFCSMLGYSLEELKDRNLRLLFHPDEADQECEILTAVSRTDSRVTFQKRFLAKNGTTVWAEVTGVWIAGGPDGRSFGIGIVQDITSKMEAQARLNYLDYHDKLTGLPNRTLFQDRLHQSLHYAARSGRQVAVGLLNIDRFKGIIDTLGHVFGDQALCAMAQRLRNVVREGDTVARMSGDEFAILLTEITDEEEVRQLSSRILRHLSEPLVIGAHKISPSASLGISLYPRDSNDVDSLLRNADLALNRAKRGGGNIFSFYAPEMNLRAQYTLELENGLRQALSQNEFQLLYQPKVRLKDGRILGCEALIRWNHPRRGVVSPADFIPLAEETGLIVPIGSWALKEACRQNKRWGDAGLPPMRVAVNLSARQFYEKGLTALVQQILDETELQPQRLELELTESMLIDDPDQAVGQMGRLKDLGVHLALDDFGTGYSSLAYLSRFPIDCLKIDRSFVDNILSNQASAMISTSIIALAHRMQLRVVAEGVESKAQLDYLKKNDCDEIQGFYFSPPVSAAEFESLLRENRTLGPEGDIHPPSGPASQIPTTDRSRHP